MIHLGTSVALAHPLAEGKSPPVSLWDEALGSSRLHEYEAWTRIHARGLAASHGEPLRLLLARVSVLEMVLAVLARALEPFPPAVRTLDALHLASVQFLRDQRQTVSLASYDDRLNVIAAKMGIPLLEM